MTVQGSSGSAPLNGAHKIREVAAPQSASGVEKSASASAGSSSVEVSSSAKQMAELAQLVRDAPEVRQDVVDDIRGRIESGDYQVDLDKLAESLSDVF